MADWMVLLVGVDDAVGDEFASTMPSVASTEIAPSFDALREWRGNDPDCVVIEHDARSVDCLYGLPVIRNRWPEVAVVVVAPDATVQLASDAVAAGADQFVPGAAEDVTDTLADRVRRTVSANSADDDTLRQYETIVETVPEGVFVLDEEGTLLEGNENGAEMLGCDLADIRGTTVPELVDEGILDEEIIERYMAVVQNLLSDESDAEMGTYEFRAYPDPDETRIYEGRAALRPFDEAFSGTIGVFRDITEQREQMEELKRNETIIEALPDPVYAVDEDGYFTFWNEAGLERYGISAEELAKIPYPETIAEEDVEIVEDAVRTLLSDESRDRTTVEHTARTMDGRTFPVEISFAHMHDDDGRVTGFAGIVRDITERKRRQRRLEVLNRVLRHNLRNDMNAIIGFAELLATALEDPELLAYVEQILDIADDLSTTATHVRTFQDIVEEEVPDDAAIDVGPLVADSVERLRESWPDAVVTLDQCDDFTVTGTSNLRLALDEVLKNAVVHNDRESPRVDVAVKRVDTTVTIRVEDNGPRITHDERRIISDDEQITPLIHSNGLGLWITKWIVELYDGEITIADSDPRGNAVCLRLPES